MTIADELRRQTSLLTVQTVAKYIGVAYVTAHLMGRQGRMPTIRAGSGMRVDPRALADWLEARRLKCAYGDFRAAASGSEDLRVTKSGPFAQDGSESTVATISAVVYDQDRIEYATSFAANAFKSSMEISTRPPIRRSLIRDSLWVGEAPEGDRKRISGVLPAVEQAKENWESLGEMGWVSMG